MGLKSLVAGVAIGAAATYVVIPNSPEHAVQPALTCTSGPARWDI